MRRLAAAVALAAAALPLAAAVRQPAVAPSALTLWYRQPAAQWVEALPIGNGRLAAMVFGGVAEERLQLNEDTLWAGGARGWVAHQNTDLWRATAPVDGPRSGMWPTGGAWLCQNLWEHFQYSRDRAYLARISNGTAARSPAGRCAR